MENQHLLADNNTTIISDFKDRVVLVTGGSRGIGRAISLAFAQQGARCIVNYRNDITAASALLDELGDDRHSSIQADISIPAQAETLVNTALSQYGKIDILINNAGMGSHHPITEMSYADWQSHWQSIIGLNLIAGSNLSYLVSQHMIKHRQGTIINVTSRGAFRGEPLQPAYGASKAAMNSLTQSLAYSLAPYQIFVGAVAPGFVETDMAKERLEGPRGDGIRSQSPMNRVAKPEEVAKAVLLMASSPIWMTGGIFDVNGASYFRT